MVTTTPVFVPEQESTFVYQPTSKHKHHYLPTLTILGRLIGLCSCAAWIEYDELVRRINRED